VLLMMGRQANVSDELVAYLEGTLGDYVCPRVEASLSATSGFTGSFR
jgi:hypothetical protein